MVRVPTTDEELLFHYVVSQALSKHLDEFVRSIGSALLYMLCTYFYIP